MGRRLIKRPRPDARDQPRTASSSRVRRRGPSPGGQFSADESRLSLALDYIAQDGWSRSITPSRVRLRPARAAVEIKAGTPPRPPSAALATVPGSEKAPVCMDVPECPLPRGILEVHRHEQTPLRQLPTRILPASQSSQMRSPHAAPPVSRCSSAGSCRRRAPRGYGPCAPLAHDDPPGQHGLQHRPHDDADSAPRVSGSPPQQR